MDVLLKSINVRDLLPSHDLDDTSPLSAPDLRLLIDRLNLHSLHIKSKVQNYVVSHNHEFLTLFQQSSDSVTNSQHLSVKVADLVTRLDDNEIENVERIVDEIRVRRGEMKEKKEVMELVNVVVKMSEVLCGVEGDLGCGKFVEAAEAVTEMKEALRVSDGAVEVREPVVFGLLRKKWADCFEKGWWLLSNKVELTTATVIANCCVFVIGYLVFRGANKQKHDFKKNPKALNWGQSPKVIGGKLLVSGYWGIFTGSILLSCISSDSTDMA